MSELVYGNNTVINPAEEQYLGLCNRIVQDGVWVENKRTGKRCLTVIDANLEYNVKDGIFPLGTTRKSFWKAAVAELLGYIRGYTSAEDFRKLGTKTWDMNANDNAVWLANPARKGTDDMGFVYGAVGRNWPVIDIEGKVKGSVDLFRKVYENLRNGIDDRGETITFWNPGVFDLGCLRPCMHTHTFSILGDTLYLTSMQR